MRRVAFVSPLAAALVAASACAGASSGGTGPGALAVALSSAKTGARPVALHLAFRTDLQCGRLVGGTVVVHLPAAERVPATIPAAAVRIGGLRSGGVSVSGKTLTVSVRRPSGVICGAIAPGTAKLLVTAAARLGNPPHAGRYTVTLERGGERFRGRFAVR